MKQLKIKSIVFYCLLFFLFLFWNLIIQPLSIDEVWNYGFAHNISLGMIPYKDFNMILTPFYSIVMAIGLKIFGSSMLVFHIEHAIILTFIVFFLSSCFKSKENIYVFLLVMFFPRAFLFPSYNVFSIFLFSLLIYLEKKNINDYWIGIVLGLFILNKQSVGVCVCLVTFYYLFIGEKKKFFKRIIGIFIPISVFLVFLFITDSLNEFLNLCVFGLFDFANNNSGRAFDFIYLFSFFVIIAIIGLFIRKDKFNIFNYYTLAMFSVVIPLIDMYHFHIAFLCFFIVLLIHYDLSKYLKFQYLFLVCIMCLFFFHYRDRFFQREVVYPNSISHFEYRYMDKESIDFTKEMLKYMSKNKDKEFIFLNANAYYFRLITDTRIGYQDLINQGNWGVDSNQKIFKTLSKKKDAIFVIDQADLNDISQTNKEIIKYVMKKCKKIDTIRIYDIYVFE